MRQPWDAYNVVLDNKVKLLDLRYNFLLTLLEEFDFDEINANYGTTLGPIQPEIAPPADIIHFCSPKKPWNCTNIPYANLWLEYLLEFLRKHGNNLPSHLKKLTHLNRIIVSLTSYSSRVETVNQVIKDLKNQYLAPEKIILWLSHEEFSGSLDKIPVHLSALQDDQFEIRFCRDIKSYKKLIPTLELYGDRVIVTADDDQRYNKYWLWELFQSFIKAPNEIHCHRCHKITFSFGQVENYNHWLYDHKQIESSALLFPTGCGGILYPPDAFLPEVLKEEKFVKFCPSGDDIWFWAMGLMKNRRFRRVANSTFEATPIDGTQETSLYHYNIKNNHNDVMLRKIFFYYPFIKTIIFNEAYEEIRDFNGITPQL